MNHRNRRILDLPREGEVPCQFCSKEDGTIVAAHSNEARHGKGFSIKAHDVFVAYLCRSCHDFVDQDSKADQAIRQSVWQAAHVRSVPLFLHLVDADGMRLLMGNGE